MWYNMGMSEIGRITAKGMSGMKSLDRRTVAVLAAFLVQGALAEDSAIAPKFLWTASEASAPKVACDAGVTWKAL